MADLTYAEISKLLKYDPDTGKLFWLPRTPDMFKKGSRAAKHQCAIWNGAWAHKEAFTYISCFGYRTGTIFSKEYKAHRVIWLLHTGEWPSHDIDHINGVKLDNRIANLRDIPNAENMKNRRISARNSSGVNGVVWRQRQKKWQAQIRIDTKQIHLGTFSTLQDAVEARRKADIEFGFHQNHGC